MISYFLFIKFIKILCLKICSKIVSYTLASYFRISAVEMVQIGLSLTEILNQMRRKFSIKSSHISIIYYDSTIKGRQYIYFTVKYCWKNQFKHQNDSILRPLWLEHFWGKKCGFVECVQCACNFVGNLTQNVSNSGVGEFLT